MCRSANSQYRGDGAIQFVLRVDRPDKSHQQCERAPRNLKVDFMIFLLGWRTAGARTFNLEPQTEAGKNDSSLAYEIRRDCLLAHHADEWNCQKYQSQQDSSEDRQ